MSRVFDNILDEYSSDKKLDLHSPRDSDLDHLDGNWRALRFQPQDVNASERR